MPGSGHCSSTHIKFSSPKPDKTHSAWSHGKEWASGTSAVPSTVEGPQSWSIKSAPMIHLSCPVPGWLSGPWLLLMRDMPFPLLPQKYANTTPRGALQPHLISHQRNRTPATWLTFHIDPWDSGDASCFCNTRGNKIARTWSCLMSGFTTLSFLT